MMVFAIAVALVVFGMVLRLPMRLVAMMLAALWTAALLAHLLLPGQNPLVLAIGGNWQSWAALGAAGAVVLAYRAALGLLRAKAWQSQADDTAKPGSFSASELDRYARHIVLREIGGTGQRQLKSARVLVVGAGGLGSPALLYLAASGVGTIGVIDDDEVSNSNLQRQIIHGESDIGRPKVTSAETSMRALNPFITVKTYRQRVMRENAASLFADYDLILDGSDSFDTRYVVNAAAVASQKPLVSAAISQWEGQIGFFDTRQGGPCYACIFSEPPEPGLAPSCAEAGVVAPLPGIMGSMMALEAVKYLTGAGEVLAGSLLIYDGLWGETRRLSVKRHPDCKICGSGAAPHGPQEPLPDLQRNP